MMPSVSIIIKKLKLTESNVLNIYQYGSRFWGDFRTNSDYDFIIILSANEKSKEGVHCENIDATLYTLEYFQEEMNMCKFLPIMIHLLKDRSIVLERVQLAFSFHRIDFKHSVLCELLRDMKMIEKMKAKGQYYKYQKIIKHSLRMGLISFKILTQGVSTFLLDEDCMSERSEEDVHRIYEKIEMET